MKAAGDGGLKYLATDGAGGEKLCPAIFGQEMESLRLTLQNSISKSSTPLKVSQIITWEWAMVKGLLAPHHVWTMQLPCLFLCPDIQAIYSYPSWKNTPLHPTTPHPTPPHHVDFIPNTCWECLKYPLSLGFLLSFLFIFLKSNPQTLKYFEFWLTTVCEDAVLHTHYNKILCNKNFTYVLQKGKKCFRVCFWVFSPLFWSYRKPSHTLKYKISIYRSTN